VGSNSTWGLNAFLRLFCVCAIMCLQVAVLWQADPPSKGHTNYVKDQENKKRPVTSERAAGS
jgi:hypothetical protein